MRSSKTPRLMLAVMAGAIALSLPALAQGKRGRDPAGDGQGPRAEMRARVQEKLVAFLTQELASRAALDAQKTEKLGVAVRKQVESRAEHRRAVKQEVKKLRSLVEEQADDNQVRAQLDKVLSLGDRDERIKGFIDETRAFLSAQEQARIALAFPEVMREARHMMAEAKGDGARHGGRHGGRPGRGRGGSTNDDDGDED